MKQQGEGLPLLLFSRPTDLKPVLQVCPSSLEFEIRVGVHGHEPPARLEAPGDALDHRCQLFSALGIVQQVSRRCYVELNGQRERATVLDEILKPERLL